MKKKFNFKLTDRRLILIVVVAILIPLMMDFNNRMVLLLDLEEQRDAMGTQASGLVATKQALQTQIAYATSADAVEQWARENAGLIQEGDIPIILIPPKDYTPQPTIIPVSTPQAVANWEIWRELFFGD